MKRKNIFWGLIFIFIALSIIASVLDIIGTKNIISLAWSIILGAYAISQYAKRHFVGGSLALGIVTILNAEALNIEKRPVAFLLAAFLLGVGLQLLFKGKRSKSIHLKKNIIINGENISFEDFKHESATYHKDNLYFSNNFGTNLRYVHSQNLTSTKIENNLGSTTVYFENATFNPNGCDIEVECNLGNVKLYFPRNINIQSRLTATLGSVKGNESIFISEDYPTVFLKGEVNLGEIEIIVV